MDLHAISNKLRMVDCLTDVQKRIVYQQRIFVRDIKLNKTPDSSQALHILRSIDNKRYSNFCNCLRQTNQWLVSKVARNGGGCFFLSFYIDYHIVFKQFQALILKCIHVGLYALYNFDLI